MRRVDLTLDAGGREADVHPMYDLLANGESVDRGTAVQWSYNGSELAMLHYLEGDREAFRAAARAVPQLVDLAISPAGDAAFYAFVNCDTTPAMRQLFAPLQDLAVIPVPPVTFHADGRLSLSLVGPAGALQAAIEAVPAPVSVTVDGIGDIVGATGGVATRLSTRQWEALETAFELGYYAIPREADHRAVAEAMGCAPSTAAEHLRKAEATVVRSAVDLASPP